jgi:hypothetical protein
MQNVRPRKDDRRYKKPTHEGCLVHSVSGRRVAVKLTRTAAQKYWATPTGVLYKAADGVPKGSAPSTIWSLDINSIQERQPHGSETV